MRPKRPRQEETPAVPKPALVIEVTDTKACDVPSEPDHLLLLGHRVLDPCFVVSDVSWAQIEAALNMPPCFSALF